MGSSRRQFVKTSAITLPFLVAGKVLFLSPAEAFAAQLPTQLLSTTEVETLHVLAEAIVPGARKAGIAHYIDKQLAAAAEDSLLMLKYLGVPPPYAGFYQSGLASSVQLAKDRFEKPWAALNQEQVGTLVDAIAQDNTPGWSGAPASFFFFVLRADATDVVYGTEEGFERIEMPYMAHIAPVENW
ncbi:MAG: gluconate 2-dehydrogenase subunit 3 family protein [Pseudomonadales bacterium]